jgi:hypothetical protein
MIMNVGGCSCGDAACKGPFAVVPKPFLGAGPLVLVQPEPEIVSEIDGWQMETANPQAIPWMYNTCSLLSHYCPKTGWRQYMVPDEILNTGCCAECHEDIPDSVLAVWHLYNADEKLKYDKQNAEVAKKNENMYCEAATTLWPDSKPIGEFSLFEDLGNIYGANGELLNDEIGEWNGTEPEGNLLYGHDESLLDSDEEDAISKVEATSFAR